MTADVRDPRVRDGCAHASRRLRARTRGDAHARQQVWCTRQRTHTDASTPRREPRKGRTVGVSRVYSGQRSRGGAQRRSSRRPAPSLRAKCNRLNG
eukprot:1902971-Pleurochrysis_carterae.AAC.2